MLRFPLLALLFACNGPGPCLDACTDDSPFWDACYDTFVQDYQLSVECWDEVDDLGEALANAGDDDDARGAVYSEWSDDGKSHACEDADEILDSCITLVNAEFSALDKSGKEDRRDECLTDDPDDEAATQAMEDLDCEGFLQALGLIE